MTRSERAIAELAARQHGVATAEQLHEIGFDTAAIKRRVRAGRLHRLHRGVYLAGHPVAPEYARELAAVLACGHGAVASHRSAARLWELGSFRDWTTPVEVTVSAQARRRRPGIRVCGVRALERCDIRTVGGVPVTSPARTLLDIATLIPLDDLEIALSDARARRLLTDADLSNLLARSRGRRGAVPLRRLIDIEQGRGLTRSAAEHALLRLVRAAALPIPRANARIGSIEVDFVWRSQKLIVEVDGYAFHSGRLPFERDRERDAKLAARGYVVIRVTWRQLANRREALIARIASALALRE